MSAAVDDARAAAELILRALDGPIADAAGVAARLLAATDSPLHSFDLLVLCSRLENAVDAFSAFVFEAVDAS